MHHLRQLGGAYLEDGTGPVTGPPAQRHRIALLTLLARTRPVPIPREKLLALLWPEHPTASARRLLNLAVHVLRRALGPSAIRAVGDGLVLDQAAVGDDVTGFETALNTGDLLAATGLYRGPFLDGFFLPAAPEFDRWADGVRARLAAQYAHLLDGLARQHEQAAEWRAAIEYRRRLMALDPGNGAAARRLMLALETTRDLAGALGVAREHARFMATEVGTGPDSGVASLAEALRRRAGPAATARPRPRVERAGLAVLPFLEVSGRGDEAQQHGEGLALALHQHFARLPGLQVGFAGNAFGFRGRGLSVTEVGAALGVLWVVEGTVRRAGDRVRVSAHLVDAVHGLHRWSATYDRRVGDPFTLEEELAAQIGEAIEVELAGGPPGVDGDGRSLVLRGRLALGRRTVAGLHTARRFFTLAAERRGGDPSGFAGLADAYAVMGFYDLLPPAAAFGSARRAARAALAMNPRLAPARATLAYTDLYHGWDFSRAEARFRRAIAQAPTNPQLHQWYGNLLAAAGRGGEAVAAMTQASALDPQSLVASAALGWALYLDGRAMEAVEQCQATLELDPTYGLAHLWQGLAWQTLHRWDEAFAALREAERLLGERPDVTAAQARALAAAGDHEPAERYLAAVAETDGYLPSFEVAKVQLALGRRDAALQWLERAHRERSHSIVFLGVDPQLQALHGEPRLRALLPVPRG